MHLGFLRGEVAKCHVDRHGAFLHVRRLEVIGRATLPGRLSVPWAYVLCACVKQSLAPSYYSNL
jgi:hypothetical protein